MFKENISINVHLMYFDGKVRVSCDPEVLLAGAERNSSEVEKTAG